MRLLLLAIIAACPLAAAEPVRDDRWRHLLFAPELDVDVEFRIGRKTTGGWLQAFGGTVAYRHQVIWDESGSLGLGVRSAFDQWFGLRPAPRRLAFGTFVDVNARAQFSDGTWGWPGGKHALEADRGRDFPIQRSHLLGMKFAAGVDLVHMHGLSPHVSSPEDPSPELGVRPWAAAALGFFFLTLEPGFAATVPLGRSEFEYEGWFYVGVFRPYFPFTGHVGYRYESTGRFRAHYFSMGFQALF